MHNISKLGDVGTTLAMKHFNKFISMFGNFVKYSQSLNDSFFIIVFLCFVDFMLLYYIEEAKPFLGKAILYHMNETLSSMLQPFLTRQYPQIPPQTTN